MVVSHLAQGRLPTNRVRFSVVEEDFLRIYVAVTGTRTSLVEPFFRMRTASFWKLRLKGNWPVTGSLPPRSVLESDQSWAEFDEGVFDALSNAPDARDAVLSELLRTWLDADQAVAARKALAQEHARA